MNEVDVSEESPMLQEFTCQAIYPEPSTVEAESIELAERKADAIIAAAKGTRTAQWCPQSTDNPGVQNDLSAVAIATAMYPFATIGPLVAAALLHKSKNSPEQK